MTTATKNEIAKAPTIISQAKLQDISNLSATAKEANRMVIAAPDEETKAFVIAGAVTALRSALNDKIMSDVMSLANNPLGFKTDRPSKDKPAYGVPVVRDCVVQALIRGLRMTGNEFNIIAGNLYVTKEGCRRLIREFPGLTDLKIQTGVPKKTGDGALVDCKATWRRDGQADELLCEGSYAIAVRVNSAMGIDAIVGKAESKLLRRIYERLVGSEQLLLPDEDDPAPKPVAQPEPAAS